MLGECTNFSRLYSTFVEAPPLRLVHVGKQEVLGLIDLMEDQWDQMMIFDPAAWGLEGEIDTSRDPQQVYGIRGNMPKMPPKKLQDERTLRSNHLAFQSQYELLATEAYLKANSENPHRPLTLFEVWTNVLDVYAYFGRLYLCYWAFVGSRAFAPLSDDFTGRL